MKVYTIAIIPHTDEDDDAAPRLADVIIEINEDNLSASTIAIQMTSGPILYKCPFTMWAWQQFQLQPWQYLNPHCNTVRIEPNGRVIAEGQLDTKGL